MDSPWDAISLRPWGTLCSSLVLRQHRRWFFRTNDSERTSRKVDDPLRATRVPFSYEDLFGCNLRFPRIRLAQYFKLSEESAKRTRKAKYPSILFHSKRCQVFQVDKNALSRVVKSNNFSRYSSVFLSSNETALVEISLRLFKLLYFFKKKLANASKCKEFTRTTLAVV